MAESSNRFSAWGESKVEVETPLLDPAEAGDLVDPAGMLALLLRGATVLSDEEVTWQGQRRGCWSSGPARLSRSGRTRRRTAGRSWDSPERLVTEAKIWLDAGGISPGPGTLDGAAVGAGSPGDTTSDDDVPTGQGSLAGRQIRGDPFGDGAGGAAQQGRKEDENHRGLRCVARRAGETVYEELAAAPHLSSCYVVYRVNRKSPKR